MRRKMKKGLAGLLTAAMFLTSVPVYGAPSAGGEDLEGHQHTDACYRTEELCVHVHTDACYPKAEMDGTATPSEAERPKPTECAHVCSEETGCITKILDCPYETDEELEKPENDEKPAIPEQKPETGDGITDLIDSVYASYDKVSVVEAGEETKAVAKIGDKEYDSLEDAWKAAVGKGTKKNPVEITLMADTELSKTLKTTRQTYVKLSSGVGGPYTISRGAGISKDGDLMLDFYWGGLELEDIVLDGAASSETGDESESLTGSIIKNATQVTVGGSGVWSGVDYIILGDGCVLQNNATQDQGGALHMTANQDKEKKGKLEIQEGAVIQDNYSESHGGGIYTSDIEVQMTGGEITGNMAKGKYVYGGGIDVSRGSFSMTGGRICENTLESTQRGGGLYYSHGAIVRLTGGEVSGNQRVYFGKEDSEESDISNTAGLSLILGEDIQIGQIQFSNTKSYLELCAPLEHEASLKYAISGKSGDTVVRKGADFAGDFETQKEMIRLNDQDWKLDLSSDRERLVLAPAVYKINIYVQDKEGVSLLTESYAPQSDQASYIYIFHADEDLWSGDKYLFPEAGKWKINNGEAKLSVEILDEGETAVVTVSNFVTNYASIYAEAENRLPVPSQSELTIDYTKEDISYDSNVYEVYVEGDDGEPNKEAPVENGRLSEWIPDTGETATLWFRSRRTAENMQSMWQKVVLSGRPAKPEGFATAPTSYDDIADGQITGLQAGVLYQLSYDQGQTWESRTADQNGALKDLKSGKLLIRFAATESSFSGKAAEAEIQMGESRTHALRVTAPTFESVVYGYDAPPEAMPIELLNIGNGVVRVEKMMLGGTGAEAFVLKSQENLEIPAGETVQYGSIQPKAGLEAGDYIAELTVIYTGGETAYEAKTQVRFTVKEKVNDSGDSSDDADNDFRFYDPVKGWGDLKRGIVTGKYNQSADSGYSCWILDENGWWLKFVDGSWPVGSLQKDAQGNARELYRWELVNGVWYAFGADGYLETGLFYDAGYNGWFYVDTNAGMLTGWQLLGGTWHYFNPVSDGSRGIMRTGWQEIDGKWYYFYEDGSMAINTTVDGYQVGVDGAERI